MKLVPLDLLQALLPLGVLDPVADHRSVLADVVLKPLQAEERALQGVYVHRLTNRDYEQMYTCTVYIGSWLSGRMKVQFTSR